MLDYDRMIASQRKWMLYLIAIFIIGAGITPYPHVFLGLLLGSVISLFNLWFLQRKVNAFGQAVTGKGYVISLGTFTRLVTTALAILIALRFEQQFHIYSVVIGLATSYVIMMVDIFFRAIIDAIKS